ncbi:MAG: oligopeptidase A, partial [Gammaproteobacteria bacterium]|nr:oligopeptidase A [Gammaproteobacteria bacterium]
MSHDNPLLQLDDLPRFSAIRAEHVLPALATILDTTRADVERILTRPAGTRWQDQVGPLEACELRLKRFWSPVSHLHAVMDSPELRSVYNEGLLEITRYQANYA